MDNEETVKETTSTTKDGITVVEETQTIYHLTGGYFKRTRIKLTKDDVKVIFLGNLEQESHQRGQANDVAMVLVYKNGERVGRLRRYAHYASGLAKAYELIRKN